VSRTRNQNQIFVVLLLVLLVALWYGGVFAATAGQCRSGSEQWVWTPPPHWHCTGFVP